MTDAIAATADFETRVVARPQAVGRDYREDIDGLRAVAVLSVVAYHALPWLAPGGFSGVDIFFVISGYLISGIILRQLAENRFSFADFYAHRVRRIFPALIVILIASWSLGWALLAPADFLHFSRSLLGGIGFFANFTAAHEDYFHALGEQNFLLHLWSLGIEEQFYLVWPIALFLLWRWKKSAVASAIAVVAALSFIDSAWRAQADSVRAFYFPDSRMWELALGALLAHASLLRGLKLDRWKMPLSLAGVAAVLVSVFALSARLSWPGWWALFPVLGTACLLAAGSQAAANRYILSLRPMVAIGKISYPLYLWHWPLLVAARVAPWGVSQDIAVAIAVAASFVLATVTYLFVERPIRFGRWGHIRTIGPVVAMLLPLAMAGIVFAGNGLPARFPPPLQEILGSRERMKRDARRYGYESCFVNTTPVRIDPSCIDSESAGKHELVAVWGDSHAFALFSGLRALQRADRDFRLALFARGSCPFFAVAGKTWSSDGCQEFNAQVKARIQRLKPDVVLLDSFWADAQYFSDGALDTEAVRAAISWLYAHGVKRVVVVGTVPVWQFDEPTIIARLWRRTGGAIPAYASEGLNPSTFAAESDTRRAVSTTGAVYVSLLEKLCPRGRCRLMADAHEPMQFDGWHLTPEGSRLVGAYLLPQVLQPPQGR